MTIRVALLASCTVQPLAQALGEELRARGIEPEIWCGGFNQHQQLIRNPASELYGFAADVLVLHLRGEDLFSEALARPFDFSPAQRAALAVERADEMLALAALYKAAHPTATVLLNTVALPPVHVLNGLEYNSEYGVRDLEAAYNARLAAGPRAAGVIVVDMAGLAQEVGYGRWYDPRMWYLARMPWSREALRSMAAHLAVAMAEGRRPVRKCIVLDLDNTLWGGVIGEDGLAGIELAEDGPGAAYADFQAALLALRQKGVLLAVCSKNEEADALEAVRTHPAMVLREKHFAAIRINWRDKAENLVEIAAELNLGLDSLVFIDDNPAERARVRQALPQVVTPEWPEDASDYRQALLRVAAEHFLATHLTQEDRSRPRLYEAEKERQALARCSASIEDYYRSLEMRLEVGLCDAATVARIAQLTQKTNQFNLTTVRRTAAEMDALAADPAYRVYWMRLADRAGQEGLVGVLIAHRGEAGAWSIDTFLLSCRVIGRTVENALLAVVCRDLRALGCVRLLGEYRPTARNRVVADLYPRLGFAAWGEGAWSLSLEAGMPPAPEWFTIEVSTAIAYAAHQSTPA